MSEADPQTAVHSLEVAELEIERLPLSEVTPHSNQIIHGDCLDLMREMPDDCIDLVLTDPPYGEGICKKTNQFGTATQHSRKASDLTWDDTLVSDEYILEAMRVSKNQIVFGANYYWRCFYPTRCYIVWDKRGGLPDVPFAPTEFAWTSFSKQPKLYVCRNHGFISDMKESKSDHPTQKPLNIFERIIWDFSKEGDVILDPFVGSGTTAIAAIRTGRHYIGIERERKYVDITNERIRIENAQLKLELFDNAAGG